MKVYATKKGNDVMVSTHPIREQGAELLEFEIDEAMQEQLRSPEYQPAIVDGQLTFEEIPPPEPTAEELEIADLKEKMGNDTATEADMKRLIYLLA